MITPDHFIHLDRFIYAQGNELEAELWDDCKKWMKNQAHGVVRAERMYQQVTSTVPKRKTIPVEVVFDMIQMLKTGGNDG